MSLDQDVGTLTAQAELSAARLKVIRAKIAGMTQLQSDARSLFLDGDGLVRPESARLFAHLASLADVAGRNSAVTDDELREALGAQRMLRAILSSLLLDRAKLAHLQSLLDRQKGPS